jgi:hypothetical protein
VAAVRKLEVLAAVLSLVAGGIHAMAGPAHLAEWWAYGLFFFTAAAFQAAYGLLLYTRGIEGWGGWMAVRGTVYRLGIVVTLGIILVWIVSRTVGVPVGPEAFEVEPVGGLDAVSKAVEAALVIALARLSWLASRPAAVHGARSRPPRPA